MVESQMRLSAIPGWNTLVVPEQILERTIGTLSTVCLPGCEVTDNRVDLWHHQYVDAGDGYNHTDGNGTEMEFGQVGSADRARVLAESARLDSSMDISEPSYEYEMSKKWGRSCGLREDASGTTILFDCLPRTARVRIRSVPAPPAPSGVYRSHLLRVLLVLWSAAAFAAPLVLSTRGAGARKIMTSVRPPENTHCE